MTERDHQRYYDDFSRHYDDGRDRGYHALIDRLELSLVLPRARGRRVLEAGCGTGLILRRLDEVAELAVGIDLSPGMLRRAKDRGLHAVLGSVTALPFADGSFDLACSFKVLAHVPDIRLAVAELARVTRPGGSLFLEFYNPHSLRYLARRAAGARKIGKQHTEADVLTRWDTPEDVAALLPSELSLVRFHGVRVFTPMAAAHRLPLIGGALGKLEEMALTSPLSRFGGFLVAELKKK